MTEWRAPGSQPEPSVPLRAEPQPAGRRQLQLLVLSGLLVASIAVLVLVLLLRDGSTGPATGSPDAVTDSFAAALRAGSVHQVRAVACAPARVVLASSQALLGATTSASRQGSAAVQGSIAVERLALTAQGKEQVGTVALRRLSGRWCVQGLALAGAAG
ncbi:MAG TPA: hypothetical protein VFE19_08855 [Jatrophihabitantaceae bacterium]|jgi:hypothetical protein|nr:hypothetical protein [Jatrophihabitantaceae bacterium]